MNLTWTDLHTALTDQTQFCEGYSDLYFALFGYLATLADQTRSGQNLSLDAAALVSLLESCWEDRNLTGQVEASLLVAGGIHAAVLADDPSAAALRPLYATVGGVFDLDKDRPLLEASLGELLRNPSETLIWFLREGRVQTNETSRSIAWVFPAHIFTAWEPDLTITLVDLGTSAGLNLSGDFQSWLWTIDGKAVTMGSEPWLAEQTIASDGSGLDVSQLIPPKVTARYGYDLYPVDLQNERLYLMLKACLWGDQPDRFYRFERAVEGYRRMIAAGQVPQLAQANIIEAVKTLPDIIPADVKRPHLLLVFNSAVTIYLDDPSYQQLRHNMLDAFSRLPKGITGLWLESEGSRKNEPSTQRGKFFFLKAHTADGQTLYLGELEAHPTHLYLNSGWDVLREKLGLESV